MQGAAARRAPASTGKHAPHRGLRQTYVQPVVEQVELRSVRMRERQVGAGQDVARKRVAAAAGSGVVCALN